MMVHTLCIACCILLFSVCGFAQDATKAQPDTLVFSNGERLVGKLLYSSGASVTFHSDTLGDVTVDWAKVKELKASGEYAVIGKGADLKRADRAAIAQGTVSVAEGKIEVANKSSGTKVLLIGDTRQIVDENVFNSSMTEQPGLFEKWAGTITAGASMVQATQTSRTYTGVINLARALPAESFLERRSRTTLDLAGAFGSTRQPGIASVRTEIFHGDAEHDMYFSPRAYGFGQAAFDHNFSQGLDLQQTYGLGIGLTVVKQPNEELNLKVSGGFERQQFAGGSDQNLFGSIFADTYLHKFGKTHTVVFQQNLQLSPAWTNLSAYSAVGSASLTAPVYKRMSFTIGATDAFINNPPPGFRKNSFQATTGITYALK